MNEWIMHLHINWSLKCRCFALNSNDLSGAIEEFMEKTSDEAIDSDIPMAFITFPSAKDPTFNDRFPGNYDYKQTFRKSH